MSEGLIINPLMYEESLLSRDASAHISRLGGFLTRLNLGGYELLYLDKQEYFEKADLKSSKHYGAPFLSPPGINRGIVRHGLARNAMWEAIGNSGRTLSLSTEIKGLLYTQTYKLQRDSLDISVSVKNEYKVALPCETGFHYYFNIAPAKIIFGQEFNDLKALNNISGRYINTDIDTIHADLASGEIDLHIEKVDRTILRFYDQQNKIIIKLGISSPIMENHTFVIFADKKFPGRTAVETWSAPQGTVKNDNMTNRNIVQPGKEIIFRYSVAIEKVE